MAVLSLLTSLIVPEKVAFPQMKRAWVREVEVLNRLGAVLTLTLSPRGLCPNKGCFDLISWATQ
jgi:hypothetical protein